MSSKINSFHLSILFFDPKFGSSDSTNVFKARQNYSKSGLLSVSVIRVIPIILALIVFHNSTSKSVRGISDKLSILKF